MGCAAHARQCVQIAVDGRVADRLLALEPCLLAQAVVRTATGVNRRTSHGLAPRDDQLRGNAARHVAFDYPGFGELGAAELRQLQRGSRLRAGEADTKTRNGDTALARRIAAVLSLVERDCGSTLVLLRSPWTLKRFC